MPSPGGISSEQARRRSRHAIPRTPHHPTTQHSAPPRRAQTRKINPVTTSGAQCYPRLACTLNGSLLMQVHLKPRAAPELAQAGKGWNKKRMQTHATDDALLLYPVLFLPVSDTFIHFNQSYKYLIRYFHAMLAHSRLYNEVTFPKS